jgi:amino acid adenylation domain-containing protein
VDIRPDDAAYLLYTSGSTGTPKGILVSHRSAFGFCHNAMRRYAMSPADRVVQTANPAFDVSIFDCYATWLAGATLISAPRETFADPGAFGALLIDERVTLSSIAPAVLALLDPGRLAGGALRAIVSAGEALPPELAARWSRPGLELHNAFGPTETTVVVTDYLCPGEASTGPTPIGTALPNHRMYVLDTVLRPVPIGVPGQLYIAGTGVAHGYHGRPALTAQSFLADPYSDRPGERMYATGDLVRWRSDGVLEYLGRGDRQVKLRGQRVELGEIEQTLARHPQVRGCVVAVRDNGQLTAYLVGGPDLTELRQYLAVRLPTYMIPTAYVDLPELPLTPNGKVDPARLPAPTLRPAEYVAPRTPTERWLAETWREILGVARVGAGDNLFDLGGNSLHITQLVARIRDHLGPHLSPRDLFTTPALGELAAHIDAADAPPPPAPEGELDDEIADLERKLAERAELERLLAEKRAARTRRAAARRVVPVPRDGSLVCTYQQEGLWFEHQLDPASSVYHIAFALRLRGALDVPALGRALHALVVRHESLRTRFVADGGQPRQVIDPPMDAVPLPVVDLAAEATTGAIAEWAAAEIRRPTDLAAGGLLRTPLARLSRDEHVLVLVVHHIVADGWSARILAGELTQLYAAETGEAQARLPELAVQPADYAVWQRAWLDGGERERQLDFWRQTLADLSTVDIPTDRPRPVNPTGAGAGRWRHVPDELARAVREYARVRRVSFLALAQATLLTVLHRYTGQTDLPIGSIFSGRTRADTEAMVGYFVNALVLRTRLDGDPSFDELVGRCHETVLAATAHQDVPFGLVVDALRPERVPGRNPLFQVNLSLQPPGAALGGLALDAITAEPMPVSGSYARFDLALSVVDSPDGRLELAVEYSTELFDADRIDRLLDHFVTALANGLARPDRPATGIEVMPDAERHRVVRAWNATAAGYHAEPLHHLVEAAAARTPDAVAVVDHDGSHRTYRDLDTAANRLAHRLRRYGVGRDVAVGVCLPRGADLVTTLLGVWKAGGAYVPLDPELPPERLTYLLADAAPPVVVTHSAYAPAFPTAIALDAARAALDAEPATAPDGSSPLDNAAYVLYTSGSTGVPKGVTVPHRGVHNRIAWMQETYRLEPADRVLQKTPYGFDVSVWEFFWPLVTGATLVLAAPGGHRDPEYLHRLIVREGVTTLHFVPTMLRKFLDTVPDRGRLGRVRRVFCSGEALPADAARRFLAAWPDVELHNLYGPTEAAIDVTAWRCEPDANTVPIGRPIANIRTYVLDTQLRPVPIGVPGQLFLAGVGLAHGYHDQPTTTARAFLPDPHADQPGQRMYATGDLVRWRADGVLEYLGRTDRQVKLHGQRIELGEIEHALRQHTAVHQSAVTVRNNVLTGYIVGSADPADVRRFLADRLPTYMVPTTVVALPELPVTPNGKLDTSRLPESTPPPMAGHVEPRTETERWLAGVWRDLLRVERVGVGDSFFELGANSLHTTQLTARVRDQLGIHVHLRHVFASPILEHLARYLDESAGAPAPAPDPLVPLQPDGPRPPLFLVHPVGGAVTHYLTLATMLGDDQPVHAIEDPELHGVAPATSLAERAGRYVELIRRVQPHGPYHLGGWSLGGAVAVEMAGQLMDAGEVVAVVLALDSDLPVADRAPTDLETLTWFVLDAAGTAGVPLPAVDLDALRGLDRPTLDNLALDVLAQAGLAPPDTHDDLRTRMRAFTTNIAHYAAYRPRDYPGRLVLITARDNRATADGATADGATADVSAWQARAPHLEHLTVPGDHFTMLRPPHVQDLAAIVRRYLDQR